MTAAIMAVLLLAAGLLQDLIAGPLWLGQVKVPLLLAVALYYAIYYERVPMLVAAVTAGIIQDSISLMPIGYSSFCFCLLGLAVQKSRGVMFKGSPGTAALLGAVGSALVVGLLQVMLVTGTDYVSGPWWWAIWRMVGSGLLGLVAFPVTWWAAQRLDLLVGNVEPQEA